MGFQEHTEQGTFMSDAPLDPAPPPYDPGPSYKNDHWVSYSSAVPRSLPAVALQPPPSPPPEDEPSSSCPQALSGTDHAQYLQSAEEPYHQRGRRKRLPTALKGLTRNINPRGLPGASIVTSAKSEYDGIVDSVCSEYDGISRQFRSLMNLAGVKKTQGSEEEPAKKDGKSPERRKRSSSDRACGKDEEKHDLWSNLNMETYVSKLALYGNSRLPPDLPALRLDVSVWPLLALAAHYSKSAYRPPEGREQQTQILTDWRPGAKPMYMQSVPVDDMGVIIFAIRGTTTVMDWANNAKGKPTSPEGFLDDSGNLCHEGFLAIARKMVKVVSAQLRQFLASRPGRSRYSLVFTGHSAGGAIATLLYMHTLARTPEAESELNTLASYFKGAHCITFGAPPLSLIPLAKPERPELRESLFLSFLNEGDPVARGETLYLQNLLEFFASPAPTSPSPPGSADSRSRSRSRSILKKEDSRDENEKADERAASSLLPQAGDLPPPPPIWKVPTATLSNAGDLVILRSREPGALPTNGRKTAEDFLAEGVTAATCSAHQLRGVLFGDPVCHTMRLYAGRIEALAEAAWAAEEPVVALAAAWAGGVAGGGGTFMG